MRKEPDSVWIMVRNDIPLKKGRRRFWNIDGMFLHWITFRQQRRVFKCLFKLQASVDIEEGIKMNKKIKRKSSREIPAMSNAFGLWLLIRFAYPFPWHDEGAKKNKGNGGRGKKSGPLFLLLSKIEERAKKQFFSVISFPFPLYDLPFHPSHNRVIQHCTETTISKWQQQPTRSSIRSYAKR